MAGKKVIKRKGLKNVRKTKKRRARNLLARKSLKDSLKGAKSAIASKAADVSDKIKKAISVIDKMAENGIIHPNKASRLKSRLTLAYNKVK